MSFIRPGRYGSPINYRAYRQDGPYDYTSTFGDFYRFELRTMTSGWLFKCHEVQIYILQQPGYPRGRSKDLHSTHRIYDSWRRQHYVCVNPTDPPTNVPDALTWMRMWAEGTSHYMRTGVFKQPSVNNGYVNW